MLTRCECGHDRASHYRDTEAKADEKGGTEVVTVWASCLGTFCECEEYEPDAASRRE